jgi:hypothetical protein
LTLFWHDIFAALSRTKHNASNARFVENIGSIGLASLLVSGDDHGMSMNAVNPVRVLPRLRTESRVFKRGSLGDRIDGRSREGRFLLLMERELTRQLGAPSFTQKLLIRRLARAMLRLELIDEKSMGGGTLTDHDARTFSALSNMVRLTARELGIKAAPAEKLPDLGDILAEHGKEAR